MPSCMSPFLYVDQAKIMTKKDHHVYKSNMMNKNERDRSGFECQFLFRYLACGKDIGNPHSRTLHWIEQDLAIHMEQVMHLGPRHQNSCDIRYLEEKIEEQTRSIIGRYQEAINNYLVAHECYYKACVLNKIKKPKKGHQNEQEP